MWRSYDRPMPGSIFRLPDIISLQRGITYTILPDGRRLRVPAMTRLDVRAAAENHTDNQGHDMVQALTDILSGKKPVPGRSRINNRGQAHGNRVQLQAPVRGDPVRYDPREGLRPATGPGLVPRAPALLAEA